MKYTYEEILQQCFNHYGETYTATGENSQSVKGLVNFIQDDIQNRLRYWWRKELKEFETVAAYTTGTVTVATSSGVSTVTGTSTVWTAAMVGRKFIIDDEKTAYKIASFTSTTSITLDRIYINNSDHTNTMSTASTGYSIVQDQYELPRDFAGFVYQNIRNVEEETVLKVMDAIEFDQKYPSPYESDEPTMAVLRGLSQTSSYSTGTITIATSGSTSTVTGSGTTFTSAMVGKVLRVRGESMEYTIASYASATSITLTEKYLNPDNGTNTLSTGTSYDIDPPGNSLLDLYPFPTYQWHLKYWAYCRLPRLIHGEDVSMLPDHKALLTGSLWQMALWKKNYNDANSLYGVYEKDIEVLRTQVAAIPKNPRIKVRTSETINP